MAKPKSAFFCVFALICVFFALLNFPECEMKEMEENEDVLKGSGNKLDWTTAQYIAHRDSRNPGCYRIFLKTDEKQNEKQNVVQLRHLDVDVDKQIDSDANQNTYGTSVAEKDPMDERMGGNPFANFREIVRDFLGFNEESSTFLDSLQRNFNDDLFKKKLAGVEVTKIDNFNYLLKFKNDVPLDKMDVNVDLPKRLIVVSFNNEDKFDEGYSRKSETYEIRFSALAEISQEDIELGRVGFSLNEEEGTMKISFPKKTSIEEDEGSVEITASNRKSSSKRSRGFLNRRNYSFEVLSNLDGNGTDKKSTK